jgi:hypothetical protein
MQDRTLQYSRVRYNTVQYNNTHYTKYTYKTQGGQITAICMLAFDAVPTFPSSNCSWDLQIYLLFFFAPIVTHLSVPPWMDPSMQPHTWELDTLVPCRLNFSYCYSLFQDYTLWNELPSRLLSPCN